MKLLAAVVIVVYILFSSSCLNDKADEAAGFCDSSYFVSTIKPIFIANCYDPDHNGTCHNEAAASVRGNFSVYAAAQNGIQSRLAEIRRRINLPPTDPDHMPEGRILSQDQLSKLNSWLDEGGNSCR